MGISVAFGDDELARAAQVFYIARWGHWEKDDGQNSASYELMQSQRKLFETTDAYQISWTRVEFEHGRSAEFSSIVGNGSVSHLALVNLPLQINESVLWWLHFFRLTGQASSSRIVDWKSALSMRIAVAWATPALSSAAGKHVTSLVPP